jgi:GAF domain-containing protein
MMAEASSGDLASAYGQLLNLLTDSPDLNEFLDQMVALAARVVAPAAACGLTTRRDGQPFTVATSSGLAAQIDELQYGAGEGPCLQTLRTGEVIEVRDLVAETRWPRYRPHAVANGIASSLSLPLRVGGQTLGALNFYSHQADAFAGSAREQAEAFAAQCAAALTLTLRQADHARIQSQFGTALTSRSVIDQAIGILMGQQRCTAAQAFDLLRQASQHRNRKLRDVAADIITNVTGAPPEVAPGFRIAGTDLAG